MTLFDTLTENDVTVNILMDMYRRYPKLTKKELSAYTERTELRIDLLLAFAKKHKLTISKEFVKQALSNVQEAIVDNVLAKQDIPETIDIKAPKKGWVYLLNGGPASGKSRSIKKMKLPKNTIQLDRDSYFEHLTPYLKLAHTHPNHATHAVVCEAILYNERDAYRYALLAGAENLLVDGTMSYRDLGMEMIKKAKKKGYKVKVINIDCPVELAIKRAKVRAEKSGKTINEKLLYESHVRCAKNFFDYQKKADETESWVSQSNGTPYLSSKNGEVFDADAIATLKAKGKMPLDNPSWPPNFDDFLAIPVDYSKSTSPDK